MNDRYIFLGGSEKHFRDIPTDILPDGDYNFKILDAQEPYLKAETNRWVMRVRLRIEPTGHEIFYTPSTSADGGLDRDGTKRDAIGDLFLAVNRAPDTPGEEIEVGRLLGAHGRCRLKTEIWKERERNAVARIYVPQRLEKELPKVGPNPPPGDDEPDDLPF